MGGCHLISERKVNPRERWPDEPGKIELVLADCGGNASCEKLKKDMEGREWGGEVYSSELG